jgi:hypothetical protein
MIKPALRFIRSQTADFYAFDLSTEAERRQEPVENGENAHSDN